MTLDPRTFTYATPGWYAMTLCKGGVEVPVRVWETGERDEAGDPIEDIHTFIEIDGADVPFESLDYQATRINMWGRTIKEKDYRFMRADTVWLLLNQPDDPKCHPREAIDLGKMEVMF